MKNLFVALTVVAVGVPELRGTDRPNILWVTAEDLSPALGCYGDSYAITPNLDQLAAQSVRYTHVFATAPVCSPVRSTLITGCYAPSMGTHNMRSAFALPEDITGFSALLRRAGYFTSNCSKTDYNTADAARLIEESWDECGPEAHWRNRGDDRPFFSVFNLMTSHQSRTMVWPYEKFQAEIQVRLNKDQIHQPGSAPLPPWYPDTPLIRREWARFYDCVTAMDMEVGQLLRQLRTDGLAEDTIVFFFGDHGSGMPRYKRCLLDTGMRVPLLVHVPQRWQHLFPQPPGTVSDRLLSFIDFPPTVLALAGVAVPDYMHGNSFARETFQRQYVYGHRDRVDEAFDCARSVRDRRWLYIRNYMPHLGYHQPTAWPDQGVIRAELSRYAAQHPLTAAQRHYLNPRRPLEELYDCSEDPMNLRNLATSPQATEQLKRLRSELDRHLLQTLDTGFVPEINLARWCGRTPPIKWAQQNQHVVTSAIHSAQKSHYLRTLGAPGMPRLAKDFGKVYWPTVMLHSVNPDSSLGRFEPAKFSPRDDAAIPTLIEAAAFQVEHNIEPKKALNFLISATGHQDLNVVLYATRQIELLGERARAAGPAIQKVAERCHRTLPTSTTATFVQTPEQDLAMFISFSADAFLNRFAQHKNAGQTH